MKHNENVKQQIDLKQGTQGIEAVEPADQPGTEPVGIEEPVEEPKKKKSYYEPHEELLREYGAVIDIALSDNKVLTPLTGYGYDEPRILAGKDIFTRTQDAYWNQVRAYDRQYNATLLFNSAWDKAKDEYNRLVTVARVAFKNDTVATKELHLYGRRGRTFGRWMHQAYLFLNGVLDNPAHIAAFTGFNVTGEQLGAALATVDAAKKADQEQEKAKGEAQDATDIRDQLFKELKEWIKDFRNIARLALTDNPQQLEKFGVLVRS